MRYKLFPEGNGPIILKQGEAHDCYLLASLDYLFNDGFESYALIQSLFTETAEGVTVRLSHSDQSTFINPVKFEEKYTYQYDAVSNEDVFNIPAKTLDEIELSSYGVVSNSLAVRILERLIPHYYEMEWRDNSAWASIFAHNNLETRYRESDTTFLGKLLGIATHETYSLYDTIKLKNLFPHQCVYIAIDYIQLDTHGYLHNRHALRIESIIANPDSLGGYDFILVNPWNNQAHETFNLVDIKRRNPIFCTFITKPEQHNLTQMLLRIPFADAMYIVDRPDLLTIIENAIALNHIIRPRDILNHYVALYKKVNYIATFYNALNPLAQQDLINAMRVSFGDKEHFLIHIVLSLPHLANTIIQNEPRCSRKLAVILADIALKSKDLEIYNYLLTNGFDFCRYISLIAINPDQSIKNMLELECSRLPINITMLNKIASYVRWLHIKKPGCLSFHFDTDTVCALVESQVAAMGEEIKRTQSKIASVISSRSSKSSTAIARNKFGLFVASDPVERATTPIAEHAYI